jgi:hypothetical protein
MPFNVLSCNLHLHHAKQAKSQAKSQEVSDLVVPGMGVAPCFTGASTAASIKRIRPHSSTLHTLPVSGELKDRVLIF